MTATVPDHLAEELFAGSDAGRAARRAAVAAACAQLDAVEQARTGPYSGASPAALAALADGVEVLPADGRDLGQVLAELGGLAARHAVDPTHPACCAHLHCGPLNAALAADLVVDATNPSLDSWDQSPVATHLEQRVIGALAALVGFDPAVADGVFTTGGTQSNLMGLLLARDAAARRAGRDVAADGLGARCASFRVLCSQAAHFSVHRSAWLLGLGGRAVHPVEVDAGRRLDLDALDRALERLDAGGLEPVALVATAGTTDFGSIDPLPALAERARARGLWLHVDAAYGGGLLFSERHRGLLDGLALADSVAVDFHKLLWQPIACGVFLVRDRAAMAPLEVEVAYLNPADDQRDGWGAMPHLVGRSLATSRRFDALKLLVTFHALGRRTIGALVDRTMALAEAAAASIRAQPALVLAAPPVLSTLVFRYLPDPDEPGRSDRLNAAIRARLLADGAAVVGRTEDAGRVHLKLTLLNPATRREDVAELVALVARTGAALDRAEKGR